MTKILIVTHSLAIGGGEKLVYELVKFALKNNVKPAVLVVDNYKIEHYDELLKGLNVPVVRTKLDQLSSLRDPQKIFTALYWKFKLKYFASGFNSIHVVNLNMADKIKHLISHPNRYFWHVGNQIQYPNNELHFSKELFQDKIVLVNEYQKLELENKYGKINSINFKLFLCN